MQNLEEHKQMSQIKKFTDLDTWKEGHKLVLGVYKEISKFPKFEIYGLSDQMRRCAVSITSNIAEGFSRFTGKDKIQFFRISAGSITELQNQLIIAKDLKYIDNNIFEDLFNQSMSVLKMINALIRVTKINFK